MERRALFTSLLPTFAASVANQAVPSVEAKMFDTLSKSDGVSMEMATLQLGPCLKARTHFTLLQGGYVLESMNRSLQQPLVISVLLVALILPSPLSAWEARLQ